LTVHDTAAASTALRERARHVMPGAVSAGWNYFSEIGPVYVRHASGPRFTDVDGREYLDFVMGWGSLLLGHDPPSLLDAIRAALGRGFGAQYETELHVELAERFCRVVPCADRMRLANSGLEATLYALRLARAFTGRPKVAKFEGHFHGLHDQLLFGTDTAVELGERLPTGAFAPVAGSGGIPPQAADLVVTLPFNDLSVVEAVLAAEGDQIAALILEPISLNTGCIAPDPGYLAALRDLTARHGVLLVFDEVLTGFRLGLAGAQGWSGVTPDLACYGKAFGCGAPIAAVAGRADVLDLLTPLGPVEMSGTNSGRLLAVAAALAALEAESAPGFYERLGQLNDRLVAGLRAIFDELSIPAHVEGYGGRIGVHLGSDERPRSYRDAVAWWNADYHLSCYREMIKAGLYGFLLPLRVCPEPVTLSAAHTEADVDEALARAQDVFRRVPYVEPSGERASTRAPDREVTGR
jgi:glutamate-1-semialdehyde 2,1-aminomutase